MTMDCHSAPAALAFAAICERQTCYPLANPEAADAGANFANFAAKFVAHDRSLRHADTILARMEVGPANATVMNFEYDLARTSLGFGRINYGHFILTPECCRLHFFHRPSMRRRSVVAALLETMYNERRRACDSSSANLLDLLKRSPDVV